MTQRDADQRTADEVRADIEQQWILQGMAMRKPARLVRWRKKMDALQAELAAIERNDNERAG
jgi:hypothetical protein